jgi:hypothetical protein
VVLQYDLTDLTVAPTNVVPSNTYDIARMQAASDGTVTFSGLRLSDSKEVVGRISPSGTVTISSEYTAPVGLLVPL